MEGEASKSGHMLSFLSHPIFTFSAGVLLTLVVIAWLLNSAAKTDAATAQVDGFMQAVSSLSPASLVAGSELEKQALDRFTNYLKSIGDPKIVAEQTQLVYARDAFLNDTLVTHRGLDAIREYFLKTSKTVTTFDVTIQDVVRSGDHYYIRWLMDFAAPAMNGGKAVRSIGMSQIHFDAEGKVTLHQDFWDSGTHFYAHLPVASGVIGYIRKQIK